MTAPDAPSNCGVYLVFDNQSTREAALVAYRKIYGEPEQVFDIPQTPWQRWWLGPIPEKVEAK